MKLQKLCYALIIFLITFTYPAKGIIINADESIVITTTSEGDYYLAGGEIRTEAAIHGDLYLAGGTIIINDSVYYDLVTAGGEIEINGNIGDDVRAAGGEITIKGVVHGDLILAGGEIIIDQNAIILGNVIVTGGEVKILGKIQGFLTANGGSIFLSGEVEGGTELKAGNTLTLGGTLKGGHEWIGRKIRMNPDVKITGEVTYWQADGELDWEEVELEGVPSYDPDLKNEWQTVDLEHLGKYWVLFWMIRLIGALLTIGLLLWMFPWTFHKAGMVMNVEYLRSAGVGALFFLTIPIILGLLMIFIISFPLGLFGASIFGFTLFFSHMLASIVLVEVLSHRRTTPWKLSHKILIAWAIYVGLKLIMWIPFIGWLVSLFMVLSTIGALLISLNIARKRMYETLNSEIQ